MKSEPENLLKKHRNLTHSENLKVISHVQRQKEDWFLNTVMIDGYDVPFKYKRRKKYKNLKGQRVNMTYYSEALIVAGITVEVMIVVRIKIT